MLKYFVLLLIASTCLASGPKFHFMDCVKITSGFYKNCKGKVTQFYGVNSYEVSVSDCKGASFYSNFDEVDLKSAKGCEE